MDFKDLMVSFGSVSRVRVEPVKVLTKICILIVVINLSRINDSYFDNGCVWLGIIKYIYMHGFLFFMSFFLIAKLGGQGENLLH